MAPEVSNAPSRVLGRARHASGRRLRRDSRFKFTESVLRGDDPDGAERCASEDAFRRRKVGKTASRTLKDVAGSVRVASRARRELRASSRERPSDAIPT